MNRVCSIVLVSVIVSACALTPEEELGEVTGEVQSANRLAANKLSAAKLQLAKLGDGALPTTIASLGGTADGREVLSYVIGCALAADDGIAAGGRAFRGAIGLAPMWRSRPLSPSEKRWVSACILARTNLLGIEVKLSLRGGHPVLASTLGESAAYAVVEGAFYGDLFQAKPEMYACSALAKQTGLSLSTLGARACATPSAWSSGTTACGFTYTGPCGALDVHVTPACTTLAPYANCRAATTRYAEVITVGLSTL